MSNPFPKVMINCAQTLNGALDDSSTERLQISHSADWEAVEALRAKHDAILIGAQTLRADNPQLLLKSQASLSQRLDLNQPAQPARIVLSRSGNLPLDSKLFHSTQSPVFVVVPEDSTFETSSLGNHVEVLSIPAPFHLPQILLALKAKGLESILVEGGGEIIRQFLQNGLVESLRMAISPTLLLDAEAPHWFGHSKSPASMGMNQWTLDSAENLQGMAVLKYRRESVDDLYWLRKAVQLSENCPKTEDSFAVGCCIVSCEGQLLATGYSLELGDHWHAEEVALQRCADWEYSSETLKQATVYCSLEPCSVRKSRPVSCTQQILNAGIGRVIYGMKEPDHFVQCEGDSLLRNGGVTVLYIPDYETEIRNINHHVLG